MRSDFTLYADNLEVIDVRKLICDRCGKEIDQGFADKYDMKPKAFCRIYGDGVNTMGYEIGDLEYDLCDDCANQLVTFLKG